MSFLMIMTTMRRMKRQSSVLKFLLLTLAGSSLWSRLGLIKMRVILIMTNILMMMMTMMMMTIMLMIMLMVMLIVITIKIMNVE